MDDWIADKEEIQDTMGVKLDKSISQETLDDLVKNIEDIFSVLFTVILPVIISNLIFIALSIYIGFLFSSYLRPIIFFLFSLIISVLGCGVLGIRNAIKKTSEGIVSILKHTYDIYEKTYDIIKEDNKGKPVSRLEVFYSITIYVVLPIVENVVKRKLLFIGSILFFIINKIILKAMSPIIKKIEMKKDKKDKFHDIGHDIGLEKEMEKDKFYDIELEKETKEDIKPLLEKGFKAIKTSTKITTNILAVIAIGIIIFGVIVEAIIWYWMFNI